MKVALVGYGYWGKILRGYIENNNRLKLEKICSQGIVADGFFTEDLDEVLSDTSIEVLFICTPIDTHFEICKKGLEADKHVFCEKPMARQEEFRILEQLARMKKKILYTDYIYTVSRSIRKMKEMLPECGEIYLMRGEISQYGKFYKRDSVYEVIGVHLFSVIAYLFPDSRILSCQVEETEGLPRVQGRIILDLDNGARAYLSVNLLEPKKVRCFSVYGSDGSLAFDMMDRIPLRFCKYEKNDQGGYRKLESEEWCYDEFNNLERVITDFLFCVDEKSNIENMHISKTVDEILRKIGR